eukprot:SAG22_NODE_216_length_14937_cov_51.622995_11_plen_67_part_00
MEFVRHSKAMQAAEDEDDVLRHEAQKDQQRKAKRAGAGGVGGSGGGQPGLSSSLPPITQRQPATVR